MLIDVSLVADEWPMLVLRALTLKDLVDHTVIVRCRTTHQGEWADLQPVPQWVREQVPNLIEYRFDPDLARVAKDGTVYQRPVGERGGASTPWFQHVERQHRNACLAAARTVTDDPEALILVSDVDEIPDVLAVMALAKGVEMREAKTIGWHTFEMRMHSTALNYLHPQTTWHGTCVTTLAELEPQAMRDARTTIDGEDRTISIIPNPGASVHLSWLGTDAERSRKLATFSHAELRDRDMAALRADATHINGEQLVRCDFPGSLRWPAPLLDGTFTIPESWRV